MDSMNGLVGWAIRCWERERGKEIEREKERERTERQACFILYCVKGDVDQSKGKVVVGELEELLVCIRVPNADVSDGVYLQMT